MSDRVLVLGAAGGLGRNVLDAALAAKLDVTAFVRSRGKASLPAQVKVVEGDALNANDIARAGAQVIFFCVNPQFSSWLTDFPPLLRAAIDACKATGARLVFPANVWI